VTIYGLLDIHFVQITYENRSLMLHLRDNLLVWVVTVAVYMWTAVFAVKYHDDVNL